MKFRLVKRTAGWLIQQQVMLGDQPAWQNKRLWKWRFIAALHLLILRERARKSK